MAYLGNTMNSNNVPLTYVIRSKDEDEYFNYEGEAPDNILQQAIHEVPHWGETFSQDNYKVYQLLSGFMTAGTGRTQIKNHTNDGKGAWEALLTFYEGEEAKQAMLADADQIIQDTKYQGEKKSFGFMIKFDAGKLDLVY